MLSRATSVPTEASSKYVSVAISLTELEKELYSLVVMVYYSGRIN